MYSRRGSSGNEGLYLAVLVLLIALVCVMYMVEEDNATVQINQKVESIGGTVLDIEKAGVFADTPFIRGKGEVAYKFTYTLNGAAKVGWVKDGWGYKWILDYQK